jgi:hypothetical protein
MLHGESTSELSDELMQELSIKYDSQFWELRQFNLGPQNQDVITRCIMIPDRGETELDLNISPVNLAKQKGALMLLDIKEIFDNITAIGYMYLVHNEKLYYTDYFITGSWTKQNVEQENYYSIALHLIRCLERENWNWHEYDWVRQKTIRLGLPL